MSEKSDCSTYLTGIPFLPHKIEEWDATANLSPAHLSYIISVLLPKRTVDLKHVFKLEADLKEFCDKNNIPNAISVGSSSEGFDIPHALTIDLNPCIDTYSDVDILVVLENCKIAQSLVESSSDDIDLDGCLEMDGVHPGYTKVCLFKSQDHCDVLNRLEKTYLDGQKMQKKRFERVHNNAKANQDKQISLHGPAVSVEYSTVLDAENIETFGMRIPLDLVLAVPISHWPAETSNWVKRMKIGKWLNDDLLDAIVSNGCHVVPVSHKHSVDPDIEWRLSFATNEKQIAQNAVTLEQRQCYIYFKLLRYLCFKDLEVISSYCLKTVFYYACERIPTSVWEKHQGSCLLYLLDSLIYFVKLRIIPSFFIPENNLADDIAEEKWLDIELRLDDVRKDPISPILKLTDSTMVGRISIPYVFRTNMKYVLEDIELFKTHRNIKKSAFDAFFTSTFRMSLILLNERKPTEAVDVLLDSYPIINRYLGPMPVMFYLNETVSMIQDSRLCLLLLQELVQMSEKKKDFEWFKENLACAYHAAAYTYPNDSAERLDYFEKAEKLMKDEMQNSGPGSCGVMYGIILLSLQKTNAAIDVFKLVIGSFTDSATREEIHENSLSFGISEKHLLDLDLQSMISSCGKIEGPQIYFAYYYICKLLMESDSSKELKKYLEKFEAFCKKTGDVIGFILLGYNFLHLKDKSKAEEIFRYALNKNPNNAIVLEIVNTQFK